MNRFWHWWYLAVAVAFIVLAAESVLQDMMMLAAINGAMGLWAAWFAGRLRQSVTLTIYVRKADQAVADIVEQLRDR